MKKILINTLLILLSSICIAQTQVITTNKLIINHGDIILYLSDDTCTMVSKHVITYSKFKKLDSDRDDRWFKDVYKEKYSKEPYLYSGYDLGHLTPAHITSYNDTLNHSSFSLFNQAPQVASFNRGKWAQLERHVEDSIAKYKSDAIIITGVIYDPTLTEFLGKSKIPIPSAYFKIVKIKKNVWCWVGSNNNGNIVPTTLTELNNIFKINKMNLIIK